jgi:hypothetical protein
MLERFQRRPACHEPLSLRVQSNGACSQVLAQMPPVFSIGSQTCASANSALPWRLSGARRNLDPMYGIGKGRGVESGSEFHRLRFCALRLPLYFCAFFQWEFIFVRRLFQFSSG